MRLAQVLVVDDDPEWRAVVCDFLRDAGYGVLEAATGQEALAKARVSPPVAVLLDVQMPGISGYEVCQTLKQLVPRVPVIFVSGERTESLDRAAGLLIGADDYLAKPFTPDELLARIRGLLRRREPATGVSSEPLTRREHEVLCLLAEGLRQAEIAQRLVVSPKTVGSHLERILSKLGAHSRAEAVAMAYRRRLIDPDVVGAKL